MKKSLSIISKVCICALLAGQLSGCSGKAAGTDNGAGPEKGAADGQTAKQENAAADEEKVVLRYMTWEDGDWQNFTQEFVDQYMKDHPNVIIQYEPTAGSEYMPKLKAALASGNEPDIMWVDQWAGLFENDMFEDLNPLAEKLGYDLTAHNAQHLQMATYNDKLYGLTGWAGVYGVIYNKDLFDQAGLSYPEYGWTWDDCYDAAKKITQGEGADKIYGISMPTDFSGVENILWNGGARIIDENNQYEGVLNSDKMVEAVDWFTNFWKEGLSPEPSSLDSLGGDGEMFKQGKIGMVFMTSGYIASLEANGGFDLDRMGTVCIPVKEEGMTPAVNTLLTNPICISKNSKHKEEAFKFLAARVGKETQTNFCSRGWTVPNDAEIVKSIGLMDNPLYATYGDTLVNTDKYIYPEGTIAYSSMAPELVDNVLNVLTKVYLEDADIQAELDHAVEQVKKAEENR